MTEEKILFLLKKRISALYINIETFNFSYFFIIVFSIYIGMRLGIVFTLLIIVGFPIVYFVGIPYITKGNSFGNLLMNIKIVNSRNKKPLTLKTIIKKNFYEFKLYYKKEEYSIYSSYPCIKKYKVNSRMQFEFEENLELNCLFDDKLFYLKKPKEYFLLEDINKDFTKEGKKKLFKIKLIFLIVFFSITFLSLGTISRI